MARTRQLAAIMFTGIDGYAAVLQQDENKAVELKELQHEVYFSIAGKYQARILQDLGHESLSLFTSALEAVQCAIELQQALRKKAVTSVKIGIHLGDIIYSEVEAIGEGIDVTRRLKSQAEPGGILISHKIHEEVKNQPGIESSFLKTCELEEGGRQVEVYAITNEGIVSPELPKDGKSISIEDKESAPAGTAPFDASVPGTPEKRSWFARHRVVRRYLVPVLVVGLVIIFYFNKDRIFQNWKRENKVAKAQTEVAIMFLNNHAPAEMIKQELDLALEADPEYAPALHTYAMVHLVEGDSALARQKLQKILNSDPGYSGAWNLLANLAFWQDSTQLATRYATQALLTGPTNSVATYNLGILSEDRRFYDQAESCYLKAIEIDSTFTSAYSALGALYNKLARPSEAELILLRSLRISPASPHNYRVYKNLAESHLMLQEYVTAFEYLEKAKALEPNYADTEKCFALYYEARGYMQESIPHWRMYVALETDSLKQQKAERHLDSLRFHLPE